jgi:alpha-beta hydrolase superfamily lysophospholipase
MYVYGHSMGGMIAVSAVLRNVIESVYLMLSTYFNIGLSNSI